MKEVSILDCTLRDGGRIINCNFKNNTIENISHNLAKSGIDIIEMGFIRDKIEYQGDSTFFTSMEQIVPFIDKTNSTSKYVVFVDYGMFDEEAITPRTAEGIDGIRFGFTKKNLKNNREDILKKIKSLQNKGYEIYMQDVNTFGYSDSELLELISFVNTVTPVSMGIVDTYGTMDVDDLNRIFSIIHHNLHSEIAIDFHSHNNMQLSFALSQEMIRLCRDVRKIIIDATLYGMGKCAGNLNLELIVSYMNRKLHCNYDIDLLLDTYDEYLYEIRKDNQWGYTIPSFMAGIYRAHPNNVIYLTEKFRLRTKDIKHIIAQIDVETRQTYDYDNIQRIYIEYAAKQIDDQTVISDIREKMKGREILVLVPGKSIHAEQEKIIKFIKDKNPVIFSVNFDGSPIKPDYEFYGNVRRYEKRKKQDDVTCIISSNIQSNSESDVVVNYYSLIESKGKYLDNSTIMLMNLLNRIDASHVTMAGFDGFSNEGNNYVDDSFYENRVAEDYKQINEGMELALRGFASRMNEHMKISFLTESVYKKIFQ